MTRRDSTKRLKDGSPGVRESERSSERIRLLEQELAETNSGLIALTSELEKKTEEMRAMADQQLLQAAQLATIGELAASIAHELNNPLAIVTLRIESLLAGMAESDLDRPALEIIELEVGRMSNLVSNLLQFSRRQDHRISTIDIAEEIDRTLDLIQRHLKNHGIAVVHDFAPVLPPIHADRNRLRQVFLNLFNNASDAMPGGGTLTIRAYPAGSGSPGLVVEIRDTGTGISAEDLPMVVEPFFTTKAEGKGTGLGLPISRRIIEEHGGTVEITSTLGQGTAVRLFLPAAPPSQPVIG